MATSPVRRQPVRDGRLCTATRRDRRSVGRVAEMSVAAQRSVARPPSTGRWTRMVRMVAGLLGSRPPLERRPIMDPLHVCPVCGMDVVNPVEWEESDDEHWRILLRCGACEALREVVVSDRVAERFDRILDEGCREIARALTRAERAGMEEWVEVFAAALRRDLIVPDDFGPRPGPTSRRSPQDR